MYSIADLERISGIKAHTIRIWEKRYKLFEPIRTDTNRRIYSDGDLRRILNVKLLLDEGHKISRISELTDEERASKLMKSEGEINVDTNAGKMVNQIIESALGYDESLFDKVFSHGIILMGFPAFWSKVLLPALNRIGKLWITEGMEPAEEHFISNLIKQKLNTAIDGLALGHQFKHTFLLFLPEGEHHDMGLSMCHYILRSAGIRSVNLGQNVPMENIINAMKTHDFDYALSFSIGIPPSKGVMNKLANLPSMTEKPLIMAGSPAIFDEVESLDKRIVLLPTIEELEAFIASLMNFSTN